VAVGTVPAADTSAEEQAIRAAAEQEAMTRLREAERREEEARIELEKRKTDADAERRIGEVERMRRDAERRLLRERQVASPAGVDKSETPSAEPGYEALLAEFAAAERQADRDRLRDESTRRDLEEAERHLNEEQERALRALDAAGRRLQAIEDRAAEAEARAERAERLAELKTKEVDRARRLREMLERVGDAERRAYDAEARAQSAVEAISAMDVAIQPPEDASPRPKAEGSLSLNSATYEELRALGLSVAETGRLLAERERMGGFGSLDEVSSIRGLPQTLIEELGDKVTL
jgi:DNA uptake protein ComE-like DNA-binding protein